MLCQVNVLPKSKLKFDMSPFTSSRTGQINLKYKVTSSNKLARNYADRESFPDAEQVQADLDLNGLKIGPRTFIVVSTQGEGDEDREKPAGSCHDLVRKVGRWNMHQGLALALNRSSWPFPAFLAQHHRPESEQLWPNCYLR